MPEDAYSRVTAMDATKASARLPGLDIDILHRQSPDGEWEQISINLRATPSFEAFGRFFGAADPFGLWAQAARLMWAPWLMTAQRLTSPERGPQALPSVTIAARSK